MRKTLYIKPNRAAIAAAKRGLEARKKAKPSKRGGLTPEEAGKHGIGSGVARARDIIAGKRVNAYQIKAFFDRHKHNYLSAKSKGLKAHESKAIQAWLIWGGEPLRKQAEKDVAQDKKKRRKENPAQIEHIEPLLSPNPKCGRPISAKLEDAAALAKKHPKTLKRPSKSELRKVRPGDFVKVAIPGERFWVVVTGYEGKKYHGQVDNILLTKKLKYGDNIYFYKKNIYDIIKNKKRNPGSKKGQPARINTLPSRWQAKWIEVYEENLKRLKGRPDRKEQAARIAWSSVQKQGCKLPPMIRPAKGAPVNKKPNKRSRGRKDTEQWSCPKIPLEEHEKRKEKLAVSELRRRAEKARRRKKA